MPDRQRAAFPFGGGLDRASGVAAAGTQTFRDLRNVQLHEGKLELRRGLLDQVVLAGETGILGIYPVRSQGVGVAITWRASDRRVSVWQVNGAGDSAEYAGTVWTLAAGAEPRVIAADSFDKLFIAHDEAAIGLRRPTRYYDVLNGTITTLGADLDRSGSVEDIAFRGVTRHLSYIVGWGYGTGTEPDRADIARVSLPGEPTLFEPEHYWQIGQRGDPILNCSPAGQVLLVSKPAESHDIIGYDRATFGQRPADLHFGIASPRLAVTVEGINYRWSLDGPRASSGGQSRDLALPLRLNAPEPADLVALGLTRDAFACYLPSTREVLFVFGHRAYVLHLEKQGEIAWSYREFGQELYCAGILYEVEATGGGAGGAPPVGSTTMTATITSVNHVSAVRSSGSPYPYKAYNAEVNVTVAPGPLIGGETIELWTKVRTLGAGKVTLFEGDPTFETEIEYPLVWTMVRSQALAGLSTMLLHEGALPGVDYDYAIRLKRSGAPATGYVSADPTVWPLASRTYTSTPVPAPTGLAKGLWSRNEDTGATLVTVIGTSPFYTASLEAPLVPWEYMTYHAEVSPDGVAWSPLPAPVRGTDGSPGVFETLTLDLSGYEGDDVYVRVDQQGEGLGVASGWSNVLGPFYVGPEDPPEVEGITDGGFAGDYAIDFDPLFPVGMIGADAEYSVQIRTRTAPGNVLGTPVEVLPDIDGNFTVSEGIAVAACPNVDPVYGQARLKVVTAGLYTDYSKWAESAASVPSNC
jgi:hypothetical protein